MYNLPDRRVSKPRFFQLLHVIKKCSTFRKLTLIAAFVTTLSLTLSAKEVKYSYSDLSGVIYGAGSGKAEHYDVAIKLDLKQFRGARITGIEVPSMGLSEVGGYTAWLSTELKLDKNPETGKKENMPDICSVTAEDSNGWVRAHFSEPYVIGDAPVYVGYSFDVTSVDVNNQTDPARTPIAITPIVQEGALFVHTARHWLKWADRSSDLRGSSAIAVIVEGDFPSVSASLATLRNVQVQEDAKTISIPLSFRSFGAEPISSLEFEYSFQGKTSSTTVTFDPPINPLFGHSVEFELNMPNEYSRGTGNLNITLTKINGQANTCDERNIELSLSILQLFPKKLPLVEEYTGLWCGFCPRGYVMMENMSKEYPDEFIGVAIHNADDMEVLPEDSYPVKIGGFPAATIDRRISVSPSYGVFRKSWLIERESYSPVEINVTAWKDASNPRVINITAGYRFVEPITHEHRMAYMLLANGLKDENWKQTNYFPSKNEEYMEEFKNLPNKVSGLVFNDVLVQHSPLMGVEGSVPMSVEPYTLYTHDYVFNTEGKLSTNGVDLIGRAGDNLTIVAMIIDTETGAILNAAKTKLGDTSVNTLRSSKGDVVSEVYYDLAGRKINSPQDGFVIVMTTYTDGTTVTTKKLVKK